MTARLAAVVAGTSTVCLLVGWVVLCWEQLVQAFRAFVPRRTVAPRGRDAESKRWLEDPLSTKGKGF